MSATSSNWSAARGRRSSRRSSRSAASAASTGRRAASRRLGPASGHDRLRQPHRLGPARFTRLRFVPAREYVLGRGRGHLDLMALGRTGGTEPVVVSVEMHLNAGSTSACGSPAVARTAAGSFGLLVAVRRLVARLHDFWPVPARSACVVVAGDARHLALLKNTCSVANTSLVDHVIHLGYFTTDVRKWASSGSPGGR